MGTKYFIIFVFFAAVLLSCETRTSRNTENSVEAPPSSDQPAVSIRPYTASSEYPDAMIELIQPTDYEELAAGKLSFQYDVKNFRLDGGNYITLKLNQDFSYESTKPDLTVPVGQGNYVALSFLCLPNHISLKNYGNYVVRNFQVGKSSGKAKDDTKPMIFYHYPDGQITRQENGVLLDFYLLNTSLGEDGYKVKIEIADQEFLVEEWVPYLIEGLKNGEHNVTLSLLDKNNKPVNSVFHTATGSFTLK